MAHDSPDSDFPSLLQDVNANLSDAIDAWEKGDMSDALRLVRNALHDVRNAIDDIELSEGETP
jgi:hypothetical protein